MKNSKNIWASTEDLLRDTSADVQSTELFNSPLLNDVANESDTDSGLSSNRRDFLKYLGFGLGAATIAASCEAPIRKALPYVTKPDAIVPGVASYYASTFVRGGDFCPVLVKTREGRPIKIEGNPLNPLTKGGTSARAQASVLDLYNTSRIRNAGKINFDQKKVEKIDWSTLDSNMITELKAATSIRIVGNTDCSPSHNALVNQFVSKYPATKVVTYDAFSSSAQLDANNRTFGVRAIPNYNFDQANVVVSFAADLLGTWLSYVEYSKQVSDTKTIIDHENADISRLYVVESNMSITGSNADHRVLIKPTEIGLATALLNNELATILGGKNYPVSGSLSNPKSNIAIKEIARDLAQNKGKSIVVSGSNNLAEQLLINNINLMLENYGATVDMDNHSMIRSGSDQEITNFINEVSSGQVDFVIFLDGVNPVYDLPEGAKLAEGLKSVKTKVSFSILPNETWELCDYAVPTTHWLESWYDGRPKAGLYTLTQPTIRPLFETRSHLLTFIKWTESDSMLPSTESLVDSLVAQSEEVVVDSKWNAIDKELMQVHDFISRLWEQEVFPKQTKYATFRSFWDNTLHDGFTTASVSPSTTSLQDVVFDGKITSVSQGNDVIFYEPLGVGAGHYADNPWLQEMPDAITRVVWDNYVHLPIEWDGTDFKYYNNITEDGTLVNINSNGIGSQVIPVVRQFGQTPNTFAVALGYGRTVSGAAGLNIGVKVTQYLTRDSNGYLQYVADNFEVSNAVGKDEDFASVQLHHTMGLKGKDETDGGKVINVDEKKLMTIGNGFQGSLTERSVIFASDTSTLKEDVKALEDKRKFFGKLNSHTLYEGYSELYGQGHHWGLAIDMNTCFGCGACLISCMAENNVPIVGKKEVNRAHEMTWLRIDRYYYGSVENPNVVYQPMMCQHCDNAPCENVCPVAATTHSSEGLNQMTYNRCVGTRYCANNCPYKVRRFNWSDYTTADLFPVNEIETFATEDGIPFYAHDLTRMVLNPDVTVRSRGVIEKCSFCVQRLQEGKLKAKKEQRKLVDGDVKPACETACGNGSIVFGDMNDPNSEVSKIKARKTSYIALEETNVASSVDYQMKITNKNQRIAELDA